MISQQALQVTSGAFKSRFTAPAAMPRAGRAREVTAKPKGLWSSPEPSQSLVPGDRRVDVRPNTDLAEEDTRFMARAPRIEAEISKFAANYLSFDETKKIQQLAARVIRPLPLETVVPYLLIEAKSLPRSGIHYLKQRLSELLGENFSFCERYQEIGCCHRQPCADRSFGQFAIKNRQLRIRLVKSHDYNFADPITTTHRYLHRIVMTRDPLFILTSLYALDQLQSYSSFLAANGIFVQRIFLHHEKKLVSEANRLIDNVFEAPSRASLERWLEIKVGYIRGFIAKWVAPNLESQNSRNRILPYSNIDSYAYKLAESYSDFLPRVVRSGMKENSISPDGFFRPRNDPFSLQSFSISQYVQDNSSLFKEAAANIQEYVDTIGARTLFNA